MTFEEIENLARREEPLPSHPDPEEWFCYQVMEALHRDYRGRRIDRAAAGSKKQEVKQMFFKLSEDHNRQRAAWAQYQEFLRRAEGLTCEMKRVLDSRPEASAVVKLALDLYAALTGDGTMAENLKGMSK